MRVHNWEILTARIFIAHSTRRLASCGTVSVCMINEKLGENVNANSIVDLARVKARRSPMARRRLGEGGRPPT
jgi:hypothetical protein